MKHAFKTSLIASTCVLAGAAVAQESSAPTPAALEEVIVTGIRGSLINASDIKRSSTGISDAIVAEDVGKFPDANVSEALQRITGVQISRDRGGEGRFVSIRGLNSQFNLTTLNGRVLATDNTGRDFSFDIMPSEAISAAVVHKCWRGRRSASFWA